MRSKRKGGAALVAVLIMLILVAAGTAIMIVTGKGRIKEAEEIPAVSREESSIAESAADESAAEVSQPESQAEPEPEEPGYPEPQKAADYKDMDFKKLEMSTKYGILLDVDSNEILAGSNYEKKLYPASLTKIMTLIVAVENVEDPKAKYKFTEKVLAPLIEDNASMAGFEAGESVPFDDLLYGAVLMSGADATSGLANMVAGSEKEFVKLMNKKAHQLGLTGTNFTNASGLHDDDHYSTCKDMAVIMAYALQNEKCRKVLTTDVYTTAKTKQHEEGITFYSICHGRFMGFFVDLDGDYEADGEITGGKTGFTDEAGFCLEAIYEYNDKTYVALTCKSTYMETSVQDTIILLENYVPKAGAKPAADKEDASSSDDASSESTDDSSSKEEKAADGQAA